MRRLLISIVLVMCVFGYAFGGDMVFTVKKPLDNLQGFRASVGIFDGGVGPKGVSKSWWRFYSYNIYTMNSDGTDLRQLTDDNISMMPEWSPDGQYISYISGPEGSQELWVMNADGSDKLKLLDKQEKIIEVWWSPRSDAVLVAVNPRRTSGTVEGWVLSVDGKEKKRLGSSEWAQGWNHWSEDGHIVNPHSRLLSSLPKEVAFPHWSWDNKYIAFIYSGVLAIADVDGIVASGRWNLGGDELPCSEIFEWAPDGRKILISVNGYICTAEVVKGRFKSAINVSKRKASYATWNGDGTKIAYVGRPGDRESSEIFVVDADGSNQIRITNTNYEHLHLDWK